SKVCYVAIGIKELEGDELKMFCTWADRISGHGDRLAGQGLVNRCPVAAMGFVFCLTFIDEG
ncbi:hypothetical protein Dimus_013355, partial [Dionaea muscipula]